MTLLNTKGSYYHFSNNGRVISIHKNESDHNVIKAVSMAISRLNNINRRFK